MGRIMSRFPELEKLTFKPWPSRPTKGITVVRVGSCNLGHNPKTGVLYHNLYGSKLCWTASAWGHAKELVACLIKLGVASEELLNEQRAVSRQVHLRSDAKSFLKYTLPRLKENYGVTLTPAQLRPIRKLAREEKP